jgi:lipopolysaccharide cholinephosphotransferase
MSNPSPATIDSPETLQVQLRDMLSVVSEILEWHSVRYYLGCGTALGAVRQADLIPWDFDVDLLVDLEDYREAVAALRASLPPRYAVKDPSVDTTYEHLFSRVHLASVHHKYAHIDLFPLGGTFAHPRAQRAQLRVSRLLRRVFFARTRLADSTSTVGRSWMGTTALRTTARLVPRGAVLWLFDRVCGLRPPSASHLTNLTAGYLEREAMPRTFFDQTETAVLGDGHYPVPSPSQEYLERLYGDFTTLPPEQERARLFAFFDSWYRPALHGVPLELGE